MRPERFRNDIRLTACSTTTPHSVATTMISSRAEPPASQWRDGVVDAALHQKRNRQPRSVFHDDNQCQQPDGDLERPQQ